MSHFLKDFIVNVPDFPRAGVMFRDVSPLLAQKFPETIQAMAQLISSEQLQFIDGFAGIDSRGFIFASALSQYFQKQFFLVRKAGKLPKPFLEKTYSLEYGTATLQMKPGSGKIMLVDDVLATGGTFAAAADLCSEAGFDVVGLLALIDLKYLNDFTWRGLRVKSLIEYESP